MHDAATVAGVFAAERSVGKKYRPITAGALRAPCSGRRRSAANAGNCILRADDRISTQTSPNSLNSSGAGGVRNVVSFFENLYSPKIR